MNKKKKTIVTPYLIIPQLFIDISSSLLPFYISKEEEIEFDIGKVRENG